MTGERDRPSVLCVTSELPWPLDSGGHLRTFHLLRALAETFRVRLVAGLPPGQEQHVRALNEKGIDVRAVALGRRGAVSEGLRVVKALARREPYVLYHRHNHPGMRAAIRRELGSEPPDVLYLDHLDSCVFASEAGSVPLVVDLHNVYSLIIQREARESKRSWLMRQYLAHEASLLERVEFAATRKAAAILSVSEQERAHFASFRGPAVHLVPNGVDCSAYAALSTGRQVVPPNILFVGSMSWPPNAAAAQFLAQEVLPVARKRWPAVRLTIVGRNPSPEVRALADGQSIVVAENVPEIVPYLRDASLLAVPLAAGGGTRLKILEAFAAGLPVVSTPIGCEGIAAANGRELLIAEAPRFAEAVCAVLADPSGGQDMASRARELARNQYDWQMIGRAATNAVLSVVGRRIP